jgi:hypothetical protein
MPERKSADAAVDRCRSTGIVPCTPAYVLPCLMFAKSPCNEPLVSLQKSLTSYLPCNPSQESTEAGALRNLKQLAAAPDAIPDKSSRTPATAKRSQLLRRRTRLELRLVIDHRRQ